MIKFDWNRSGVTITKEKSDFDRIAISLYVPYISWDESIDIGDEIKRSGLVMPTEFVKVSSSGHWCYAVKILGFGLGVHYQWSY